jgi:hypothetical protein
MLISRTNSRRQLLLPLRKLRRVGCAHLAAGSIDARTMVPAIDGHLRTNLTTRSSPPSQGDPGGSSFERRSNPARVIDAHLSRHPHQSKSSRFRKDAHLRKKASEQLDPFSATRMPLPPFVRGPRGVKPEGPLLSREAGRKPSAATAIFGPSRQSPLPNPLLQFHPCRSTSTSAKSTLLSRCCKLENARRSGRWWQGQIVAGCVWPGGRHPRQGARP